MLDSMQRLTLFMLLLCSSCDPTGPAPDADVGPSSGSDAGMGTDAEPRDAPPGSDAGPLGCASRLPSPMPRISLGAPAFASSNPDGVSEANDGNPASAWTPTDYPAWIAYDLSGVSVDRRGRVLVALNAPQRADYVNDPSDPAFPDYRLPVDYSVEVNMATASTPPTDGWTEVARVTGNFLNARQTLVGLGGAPWIRLVLTGSGETPRFDFDVYSTPECASDDWLFMGDSITFIAFTYAFSDVPDLVHDRDPARWPAVINAAIGGTNTPIALESIDETLASFPGRFVVLAYGTNDGADDFMMEALVQRVIASGRIPVVPHMIWSDGSPGGESINAQIDMIYARYPEVLRGPDLWAVFEGRTDVLPPGEVHPQGVGNDILRQTWAEWMVAITR